MPIQVPETAAPVIRRDCDCGGSCTDCAEKEGLSSSSAVRLGPRDDAFEQEADRMAEAVMAGGSLQRQVDGEEEEETLQMKREAIQRAPGEDRVQRKAGGAPGASRSVDVSSRQAPVPRAARAVADGGVPLPARARAFFEPRFGRDLSHVRVHADADAAHAARDIGARAYTLRNHIAFAAGQFGPDTAEGRRLIAHELTHTFQQGATIRREGPSMPSGGNVTPATPDDRREFASDATRFLEMQHEAFLHQRSRDLADLLDLLRPAAENGLQAIAGLDAVQEETALREAYRNAVDALIVQRAGNAAEGTSGSRMALYHANSSHILPFAIPRSEAAAGSTERLDELVAPLPDSPTQDQRDRHRALAAARARLKVQTGGMNFPVSNWFRNGTALPANTTVRMAGNVPNALHQGLENIASQGVSQGIFTADTTVVLLLDLTSRGGGNTLYRFSHLDLGRLGSEVWIERVGEVAREGLTEQEREAMQARFDGFGFTRSGFSQSEWDEVLIGLSQIPDHQLSSLGALKFRRQAASATHPTMSGEYSGDDHEIQMFNPAYSGSLTRMGTGGAPLSSAAATVVHEVGHALDLHSLRTTNETLGTTHDTLTEANAALLAEFGIGGGRFRGPAAGAENRPRFDQLKQAADDALAANQAAASARTAARARSGALWGASGIIDGAAQTPAFRAAAIRDGANPNTSAGFPTTYPNPDSYWREYFAEAYMLHQTSPEVLARTRPNVFAFMQAEFPAQPAQANP